MPAIASSRNPARALLRRRRAADARRLACGDCRRVPLVGERVHFYARQAGEEMVCDLCRPRRADAPARTQLMHAPDSSRAVRVLGVPA